MRKIAILAIALLVTLLGCQKAQEELFQLDFERAFIPTRLDAQMPTPPFTYVRVGFNWATSPGVTMYRIQFTRDTTFQETGSIILDSVMPATAFRSDILPFSTWNQPPTMYGFRVMALSPNYPEQGNSKWHSVVVQSPAEQLFYPLGGRDIRSASVNLRWLPGLVPNANIIIRQGTAISGPGIRTFSPADMQWRDSIRNDTVLFTTLFIENLDPATQYTVQLRQGAALIRGQWTFTTNQGVNCWADSVLCLQVGDDLVAVLENIPDGIRVIYVPEGFSQVITDPINISGDVRVFGTLDGDRPRLIFHPASGDNALFILPTHANSIVFENLEITSRSPLPQNIINQEAAAHIGELRFENCFIHDFGDASGIRLQGTGGLVRIENLVINNSIFADFPGERFAFLSIAGGQHNGRIDNILITNSTFYDITHSFMNFQGDALGLQVVQSITIENSTFDQVISGDRTDRYFIDGHNHSNIPITIRNVIFGSTNGAGARGIRVHPNSRIMVEGSFRTRDWETTNTENNFDIPSLMLYNGSRTELFENPDNGDFTIIDMDFVGRHTSGDPRWRP